jgi:hypothetical protein
MELRKLGAGPQFRCSSMAFAAPAPSRRAWAAGGDVKAGTFGLMAGLDHAK